MCYSVYYSGCHTFLDLEFQGGLLMFKFKKYSMTLSKVHPMLTHLGAVTWCLQSITVVQGFCGTCAGQ